METLVRKPAKMQDFCFWIFGRVLKEKKWIFQNKKQKDRGKFDVQNMSAQLWAEGHKGEAIGPGNFLI
ncbi:MAG: hypothetical protein CM15mV78_180 [uncultured marine virus]|nr:MAG: hypothetical protein CM15mV78_180 [uncultured marine virus]